MRSQILRDIVAGCAGALLVLALIGLPGRSLWSGGARSTPAVPGPMYQHAQLLPCLFTSLKQVPGPYVTPCSKAVKPVPPVPPKPRVFP